MMISLTRSGSLAMFLPTSALTARLSIPCAAAFFRHLRQATEGQRSGEVIQRREVLALAAATRWRVADDAAWVVITGGAVA